LSKEKVTQMELFLPQKYVRLNYDTRYFVILLTEYASYACSYHVSYALCNP
jgi:hypothetical protein